MDHSFKRRGISIAAAVAMTVTPVSVVAATTMAPSAVAQTASSDQCQEPTKITLRTNLAHEFRTSMDAKPKRDAANRAAQVNSKVDEGVRDAIDELVGTGLAVRYSVYSDTDRDGSWIRHRWVKQTYYTDYIVLNTQEDAERLKEQMRNKHVQAIRESGNDNGTYGNPPHYNVAEFQPSPDQTIDFSKKWIKTGGANNPGHLDPQGDGMEPNDRKVASGIEAAKKAAEENPMSGQFCPEYPAITMKAGTTRVIDVTGSSDNDKFAFTGTTPGWATINPDTGQLTLRPTESQANQDFSFNVRVTHLDGTTSNAPVSVRVETDVEENNLYDPKFNTSTINVLEGTTRSVNMAGVPTTATVTKVSGPDYVSVGTNGRTTLTPPIGAQSGTLEVNITYADGSVDRATTRVNVVKNLASEHNPHVEKVIIEAGTTQTANVMDIPGTTMVEQVQAPEWVTSDILGVIELSPPEDVRGDFTAEYKVNYVDYSSETFTMEIEVIEPLDQEVDTDGDGVPDYFEEDQQTDPNDPNDFLDTDEDGVPDYVEEQDGTDPNDPNDFKDTDGDGVPDYVEDKDGTDPNDPNDYKDTDGDGVPDYVEDKDGTDPNDPNDYKDTDDDGLSDYSEERGLDNDLPGKFDPERPEGNTNPESADTDGDKVNDGQEVEDGTNPNDPDSFKDTDGDGVPDYVEEQDGTDPNDKDDFKDTDGDGVPDYVEEQDGTDPNDPESYKDTDDDGLSDYSEERGLDNDLPGKFDPDKPEGNTDPESADTDGDGVNDSQEVEDGTNPNDPDSFKDTDGDGVPDEVEDRDGTDPNDPKDYKDTDGDQVPDYVEEQDGTDPNDPKDYKDTDGDQVPDYVENVDGTDPNDPDSFRDDNNNGIPDYIEGDDVPTTTSTSDDDNTSTTASDDVTTTPSGDKTTTPASDNRGNSSSDSDRKDVGPSVKTGGSVESKGIFGWISKLFR